MRIVIDLQACQSSSSNRGIGRYAMALTEGIIRQAAQHEIILVLSGLFPKKIEPLKAHFKKQLPIQNIRVWYAPVPTSLAEPHQTRAAQIVREAFLRSLHPDLVLVTSLFEGFSDHAITSIGEFDSSIPTAIVLYDLIPMLYPKIYLSNPKAKAHYEEKISYLEQANLILAISDSAKQELQSAQLPISPNIIAAISAAAEQSFKKITYTLEEQTTIRSKYSLHQEFLMYTGGIDPRKNIDGLIQSFALLPKSILNQHQLAIVCVIRPNERQELMTLIKQVGLTPQQVIITGFVKDNELVALYNLCKAFIFPSKHEGFGLPILEAMLCGAPVIGSNISSIPEAIGYEAALFDPYDLQAIAKKIEEVLTDDAFRQALITHGMKHVAQFSWEKTAKKALLAIENFHRIKQSAAEKISVERPKLAFVSPLPPEQSGIAHYSAMLLPALAKFYDIDVIIAQTQVNDPWITQHCAVHTVDWFKKHSNRYQRVLYQFGNSTYHTSQFELIKSIPGVMVLHDFYLSGILSHLEFSGHTSAWSHALYDAHGYHALFARYHMHDFNYLRNQFPCNKAPIDAAYGVIVHSNESLRLARTWLNEPQNKPWFQIPHLRSLNMLDKISAREQLKLEKEHFIVCSFGFLAPTKLNLQLLKAWIDSCLMQQPNSLLIFVGETCGGYGEEVRALIQAHHLEKRVLITGWADDALFENYLSAADIAVQLRTDSRGETSGAVLACMASGLPTIVNAHGSMADLPKEAVWMLNDAFTHHELVEAINTLAQNPKKRMTFSGNARATIQQQHTADQCAKLYFDAIEQSYQQAKHHPLQVLHAISQSSGLSNQKEIFGLVETLSMNQPPLAIKQLFVDISHWKRGYKRRHYEESLLRQLIHHPPSGYRVEPVFAGKTGRFYRYARTFMLKWLNCPAHLLNNEYISIHPFDCYLTFSQTQPKSKRQCFIHHLSRRGVLLYLATHDHIEATHPTSSLDAYLNEQFPYLKWKRQLDNAEHHHVD